MRPEISILASLHLGIVLLSLLPWENRFYERYQWLTNSAQNWRMFYSAYTFREQEYTVIADNGTVFRAAPPRYLDADGGELPIRIVSCLGRLQNPGNEIAAGVWIERLAKEVAASGGSSFFVEVRALRIRNFYYSRQDGVLFREMVDELGPFRVER